MRNYPETQEEMLKRISGGTLAFCLFMAYAASLMIADRRFSRGFKVLGTYWSIEGPLPVVSGFGFLIVAVWTCWICYIRRLLNTSVASVQEIVGFSLVTIFCLLTPFGTKALDALPVLRVAAALAPPVVMAASGWCFHQMVRRRIKEKSVALGST